MYLEIIKTIKVNLLISLLIIWIFNKVMYKKTANNYSINEKISFLLIISIAVSFFITGPTLRYGFGVFLILISGFSIGQKIIRYENHLKKVVYVVSLILFLSVGLTPRMYSYKEFLENPFTLTKIRDNTEEYLNLGSLKDLEVKNIEKSVCFIPKTCIKNPNYKSLVYSEIYKYKLYK